MTKRLLQLLAILFLGVAVSPIPGGIIFGSMGGALLICTTPAFARFVRGCRRRFRRFDKLVVSVEGRVPRRLARVLHVTRPDASDEEVDNPGRVRTDTNPVDRNLSD